MNKSVPVEILGLKATADEWTAWSAVGTIGAAMIALVALLIPIIGAWRRRRTAAKDLRMRYRELLAAVAEALKLLKSAEDQFVRDKTVFSLVWQAAESRYKGRSLELLAKQPGLTDGAIDSALGAAEVLNGIIEADALMRTGIRGEAEVVLLRAHRVSQNVQDRVYRVADYHKIDLWADQPRPDLSWPA